MPVRKQKLQTRPVQGSEWMIAVRDHEFGITASEWALGTLYGTCGNWGERVYLSDKAVAEILRMNRGTVGKVRARLLEKGLIESVGLHGNQPNQHEYRLTLPVGMPPRRRGGVLNKTPHVLNKTPGCPEQDTGMSLDRTQQSELETDPRPTGHQSEPEAGDDPADPEEPTPTPDDGASGESPREVPSIHPGYSSWVDDTREERARIINETLREIYDPDPVPGGEFDPKFLPQEVNDRLNKLQIDTEYLLFGMFGEDVTDTDRAPNKISRIENPARFVLATLKGDVSLLERYCARGRKLDAEDRLYFPGETSYD